MDRKRPLTPLIAELLTRVQLFTNKADLDRFFKRYYPVSVEYNRQRQLSGLEYIIRCREWFGTGTHEIRLIPHYGITDNSTDCYMITVAAGLFGTLSMQDVREGVEPYVYR